MNIKITRTDSKNTNFQKLVNKLDAALAIRNGNQNDFFKQYNKIDLLNYVILLEVNHQTVGCGAIKPFDNESVEVKRMYTESALRGQRFGAVVLNELEKWAKDLGYKRCVLETGKDMTSAVRLYQREGYKIIQNYGQYLEVPSSVCMEKLL